MKKDSFGYRGMPFPARFVRSVDYYYSILLRPGPATERPSVGVRKIFVIKESIRPLPFRSAEARPAAEPPGKTIQRILIYDDHPDSLRLVLGHGSSQEGNHPAPPSAKWWEPVLGGMLITGALIIIFLPLFLKLPS
jgi:hypothetical protein